MYEVYDIFWWNNNRVIKIDAGYKLIIILGIFSWNRIIYNIIISFRNDLIKNYIKCISNAQYCKYTRTFQKLTLTLFNTT